jgi:hypothetical protein
VLQSSKTKTDKEKKTSSKKKKDEEEPKAEETPAAAKEETKEEGGEEKKDDKPAAKRGTSNVFALFNQSQIQEFKEVGTNSHYYLLFSACAVSRLMTLYEWGCYDLVRYF